jgi:hypothetical protein
MSNFGYSADPFLDPLFDEAGDGPLGQLPPIGRPKQRRWGYGPFRALLLVVLLLAPSLSGPLADHLRLQIGARSASAAAALRERATGPTPRHQAAPPSPSGAFPPYPLNHTFDGFPRAVGTPPTNYQMDDAAYEVGTRPTNADVETAPNAAGTPTNDDFGTGSFTGWTAAGGASIASDGSHGFYAKVAAASDSVTSNAFTVGSNAQVFLFDIKKVTSSAGGAEVLVLSGASYTTSTSLGIFGHELSAGTWGHYSITANAYKGQSIKIRFRRAATGSWGFDNFRAWQIAPGYTLYSDTERQVINGNAWLKTGDDIITSAFTVHSAAQHLHFSAKGFGAAPQWEVIVRSGAGYTTETSVLVLYLTGNLETYSFPLNLWTGQSIKVRFHNVAYQGAFDDIALQFVDVPGWTLSGGTLPWSTALPLGATRVAGTNLDNETEGTAISLYDESLTSPAFTVDADAQQLSVRHKGVSSSSDFKVFLLSGTGYATSVSLSGTSTIASSPSAWQTYQFAIGAYAGQSVKIKITASHRVLIDDVGFTGSVAPGWTPEAGYGAIAVGEDDNGTYVTPFTSGGELRITSSLVSAGIIDTSFNADARSYSLGYAFGPGTGSVGITVWWIPYVGGSPGTACPVYTKFTDNTQTY